MEENYKKEKGGKAPIIIGVTLGLFFSFIDIKYDLIGGFKRLSLFDLLFLILIFSLSLFIVIFIHELGHLTFGKIKKFKFSNFRIGPFSLDKNNKKIKFSIIQPKGYGGLTVMYPSKESNLNEFLFYLLGGIIFNLLSGTIFLLISYFNDFSFKLNSVFITLGVFSLIAGVQNLIPFKSGNNLSDGKMIFSIIKKDEFSKKFYRNFLLSNKIMSGTRPRDINSNMETDFTVVESLDLNLVLLEYFRYLDRNDKENINKYIEKIEENYHLAQTYHLPSYYYELIYYYSLNENNDKVDYYLEKLDELNYSLSKDEDINGKRVYAYYNYFILKDKSAAFKIGKEGLKAYHNYPIEGQAKMEKELIENLLNYEN